MNGNLLESCIDGVGGRLLAEHEEMLQIVT
jgi:hypothetical protein